MLTSVAWKHLVSFLSLSCYVHVTLVCRCGFDADASLATLSMPHSSCHSLHDVLHVVFQFELQTLKHRLPAMLPASICRCGFDADASLATLSMLTSNAWKHLVTFLLLSGHCLVTSVCRCGFDADASLATLSMLTSIEVRLEEALAAVASIPQEQVRLLQMIGVCFAVLP
jgi:hypothetical protein